MRRKTTGAYSPLTRQMRLGGLRKVSKNVSRDVYLYDVRLTDSATGTSSQGVPWSSDDKAKGKSGLEP